MRTGDMQIIPVNFQKRHREMLQWTYILMSKRFTKIYPSLQKLVVFYRIKKSYVSYKDDLYDCFRIDPKVEALNLKASVA